MVAQIWAHRGASAYAPENTLAAFSQAIQMGAQGIELDVHLSKDGELVVIHDETVDRTSNGTGSIAELTLKELKAMDFSNGFEGFTGTRIPTLTEVYELIKPTALCLNVEVKCDVVMYLGIWDKLIALERDMGMQGRVLYSSFNHDVLTRIRAIEPDAQIGLLYNGFPKSPLYDSNRLGANAVHPHYLAVLRHPDIFCDCQRSGICVHVWTVDDPAAIQSLLRHSVDAIITNRPDVALAMVDSV